MEDIAVVHLLLMGNLFEHVGTKESEFDLKGSSVNREVFKFTMNIKSNQYRESDP